MKKILVAIDYSPCAQKVAETGYEYAKAMNAEIEILHVIADAAYYTIEATSIMGFEGFSIDGCFRNIEEQEAEAGNFLSAVIKHLGDASIKPRVLNGRTARVITDHAAEWNADVIVMGTQSYNSFERSFLGNVTSHVVKHSRIPVLIVPTDKEYLNAMSLRQTMFLQI